MVRGREGTAAAKPSDSALDARFVATAGKRIGAGRGVPSGLHPRSMDLVELFSLQ